MDDICQNFANGTLKITTRQTWQVHGVLKRNVKATMRATSWQFWVFCLDDPAEVPVHCTHARVWMTFLFTDALLFEHASPSFVIVSPCG